MIFNITGINIKELEEIVAYTDEVYVDYGRDLNKIDKLIIKNHLFRLYQQNGWIIEDVSKNETDINFKFTLDKSIIRDIKIKQLMKK